MRKLNVNRSINLSSFKSEVCISSLVVTKLKENRSTFKTEVCISGLGVTKLKLVRKINLSYPRSEVLITFSRFKFFYKP